MKMINNILKRFFFVILFEIAAYETRSISYLTLPSSETFSFQCQDQMVKVNSTIYHLDRLRSSLKSNYFENIFTSGDFKQKNDTVLEIQPKNAEVFPSVIDLIHGKKLIDVMNKDNYLQLLETMDHLEMEIDLQIVSRFIIDNLKSYSPKDAKIFELYDFIKKNGKFEYLLTSVFKKLSNNLTTVHDREILSSLTLDHIIRIINSVENVTDKKRCEIVQTCTKWLCCDFENRLPHMAILINSVKPGFHSEKESDENNGTLVKCLPKTNVDEHAKEKITARCVFALLAFGGKLNPTILHREDLFQDECSGYYTDTDSYCAEQQRREKYEIFEQRDSSPILVNRNDEYVKLKKFLKNGDLYDITVQVGEKAYKLHRAVLESRCGYFADIFRAEYAEAVAKCYGNLTYPCKEKVYLLDAVDQSTFDAVIDFIYFGKHVEWNPNGIGRIFKTVNILRIDSLLDILRERLMDIHEKVCSSDVIEIMNCTRGKAQYDNLHLIYFCKHISSKWPEMDSLSQFCSISWPMLENVLKSPHFCPDNPHKIVDICSSWVFHDVQNRYSLLPRIAQTINPHCVVDQSEYKTEAVANLNDHSQRFVRNKLWNILSTPPYTVTSVELPNSRPKKHEEIPVFVVESDAHTIDVLNVDLDEIASFPPTLNTCNDSEFCPDGIISATMMHNHLFVLLNSYNPNNFLACIFSQKKCFPLPFPFRPLRGFLGYQVGYTLLTCINEIYCCSQGGVVMKFLMQLNRWTIISKHGLNNNLFTSDGEKLYRVNKVSEKGFYSNYVVEPYDFEKNAWSCESRLPTIKNIIANVRQLNVVKGNIAVSTFVEIILFDRKSKKWRYCDIPSELCQGWGSNIFAHCEDEMLIVKKNRNELYNVSLSNENFKLKKSVPSKYKYREIKVIHRY